LELNRRRKRVWVDGIEYGTEKEAAEAAGVSVSSIHEALKAGGRPVKGRMITLEPLPEPCAAELAMAEKLEESDMFVLLGRKPLIRYPPGEGPLYCGLRRWS
jgi:hypothetical protein